MTRRYVCPSLFRHPPSIPRISPSAPVPRLRSAEVEPHPPKLELPPIGAAHESRGSRAGEESVRAGFWLLSPPTARDSLTSPVLSENFSIGEIPIRSSEDRSEAEKYHASGISAPSQPRCEGKPSDSLVAEKPRARKTLRLIRHRGHFHTNSPTFTVSETAFSESFIASLRTASLRTKTIRTKSIRTKMHPEDR